MWNSRKKDEEAAARAATAPPTQSDYGHEAIPTSSYSTRQSDFATTRAAATIGKSLVVKGQIRGQEDLIIEGRLEGDVELPEHRLTIGVTGQVQGSVKAREIVILGTVQGNLEASERVEIKKNAKVIGDLKAQRPVIEDEAYFKGNVETIRVDKPAPKPAAPPIVVEPQASLLSDSKPEIRKGWTSRPLPTGTNPASSELPPGARRSHALESISAYLRSTPQLQVLDFGGINQSNLDFITGLGHRIYGENLMLAFDYFFSQQEVASGKFAPERIEQFLDQTFEFEDQSCDAGFVWDTLQFLPPQIAQGVLSRLYRVLAPDALLMAFFHPESSGAAAPHVCRILDGQNLQLMPRPHFRPAVPYNTRSIERFFQQFQSVKFFLTRENLQEVIARR